MDGFKPPRRPQSVQPQPQRPPADRPTVADGEVSLPRRMPVAPQQEATAQPLAPVREVSASSRPTNAPSGATGMSIRPQKSRRWLYMTGGVLFTVAAILAAASIWYQRALAPVNPDDHTVQQVQIGEGATFAFVSDRLQERRLIHSSLAFTIYARLHGMQGDIKKGTCNLAPSESATEILKKLTEGCNDFRTVTFYPGATIETPKRQVNGKDFSVYASLKEAGFTDEAIRDALASVYESDVLAGKPKTASLEGYVYGDTYYINVDGGPKQAIQYALSEMDKVIKENDLVARYKKLGLSLYEGITMASIVQRELSCDSLDGAKKDACYENQRKIAQVFYKRLADGMALGSDVTFIYAAGLTGEAPLPQLESPYNTRVHAGLPPGPIATPGKLALLAAADPASTSYVYFVAGDEGGGAVYFAKDEAGHHYNIEHYCQVLCG